MKVQNNFITPLKSVAYKKESFINDQYLTPIALRVNDTSDSSKNYNSSGQFSIGPKSVKKERIKPQNKVLKTS